MKLLLVALLSLPAWAQTNPLVPTGTLRVTFLGTNPIQGRVKGTEITGLVADVTAEIARRWGVPFRLIPGNGARGVIDAVKNHTADIGFLAVDPSRASEVTFSRPYAIGDTAYIVLKDNPLQSANQADKAGFRIGVPTGDSVDLFLVRNIKQATLVHVAAGDAEIGVKALEANTIDAFATSTQRLVDVAAGKPHLRVVPGTIVGVGQAAAVTLENEKYVETINRILDELVANGFVQKSIEKARLTGVRVAQ